MYSYLDDLEQRSIYIIREAFNRIDPLAMLWSIGKDSNVMLWLVRKAFYGRIPFDICQLDTEMELPEVYEFRDMLVKEWNIPLKIELCPPEKDMDQPCRPQPAPQPAKPKGCATL